MSRQRQQRYAYGDNTVGDCPCPAVAAGYNLDGDGSTAVAEQYDDFVRNRTPSDEGIVDADTAQDAWLDAVQFFERQAERATDPDEQRHYQRIAEKGRVIMNDLDW